VAGSRGLLGFVAEAIGVGKAAYDLEQMGKRAENVRPLDAVIRKVFLESERERFDGMNQRPKWPPLAQSTVERKARQGLDPRPLRATGLLRASLTEPGAPGQVDQPTPGSFRFGTKVPYAFYHDTGTGVPKRKLVGLTVKQRGTIKEVVGEYIATAHERFIA
jgi:phage gpG-like protein